MARATRHESLEIVRVGSGRPELWLIAGVHGDEVEGMVVVEEALRTLTPARGTLVGLPVATVYRMLKEAGSRDILSASPHSEQLGP